MTQIYTTASGILQQKESGKTTLITKTDTIEIKRLPRKVTAENAEEIAKAILDREEALDG